MLITEEIKQIFDTISEQNKQNLSESGTFGSTFNKTTTLNTSGSTVKNTNTSPTNTTKPISQPGDVNYLSKVSSQATTVNKAAQKINTTNEFSGAFKNWFSSLGYKPDNNQVNISRVTTLVKKAMTELGYK
jgi:hypothetical protein